MTANTPAKGRSKPLGGRFASGRTIYDIDHPAVKVLPPRTQREIRDLLHLARLLDNRFEIAGFRFGLDAIIGLIPGAGDAISAAISLYIIGRAKHLGAPDKLIAKMGINVAIDTLIGAVPLLGDLFDAAYKSNLKNVRLLLDHLGVAED
jgi:hypothetical protein